VKLTFLLKLVYARVKNKNLKKPCDRDSKAS